MVDIMSRGDFGLVVEDNGTHIRDITKEFDKRRSWPTRPNIAKKTNPNVHVFNSKV